MGVAVVGVGEHQEQGALSVLAKRGLVEFQGLRVPQEGLENRRFSFPCGVHDEAFAVGVLLVVHKVDREPEVEEHVASQSVTSSTSAHGNNTNKGAVVLSSASICLLS